MLILTCHGVHPVVKCADVDGCLKKRSEQSLCTAVGVTFIARLGGLFKTQTFLAILFF